MDPYTECARVLVCIHNSLRNGIESAILHSEFIQPKSQKAFKSYLYALHFTLVSHHSHEDEIAFPFIMKQAPHVQVEKFSQEHKQLEEYLAEVKLIAEGKTEFDGMRTKELLTKIQVLLLPHFREEEEVFSVSTLRKYSVSEIDELGQKIEKASKKEDPSIGLPFIYYNMDKADREVYWNIKIPWLVRKVIFPIISKKRSNAWIYAKHYSLKL